LKISNDIVIYIVEDDQIQSEILHDKLLEYNPEYNIIQFKNGFDLLNHFKLEYSKHKYNYVILDYYLQTTENSDALNGMEVIKLLGIQNPNVKIILFSAFDNDDEANFKELVKEPNVIEFVRKSEHAYTRIQNIFRFDYAQKSLQKKKRRFQWALAIFVVLVTLSILHFTFTYLSF